MLGLGGLYLAGAAAMASTAGFSGMLSFEVGLNVIGVGLDIVGLVSAGLEENYPELSSLLGKIAFWAGLSLGVYGLGSMMRSMYRASTNVQNSRFYFGEHGLMSVGLSDIRFKPMKATQSVRITSQSNISPFNIITDDFYRQSGSQFGKMVAPHVARGDVITMTSSAAGIGGKVSFAQLVANKTRNIVHVSGGKEMKVFYPLKGSAKTFANQVGSSVSSLFKGMENGSLSFFTGIAGVMATLQGDRESL